MNINPPPMNERFVEKNKCLHTNNMLYTMLLVNVINASTKHTKYKSWMKRAFITYKIFFHFPMRNPLSILSSRVCNLMIASNKQRQEHDNLEKQYD